MHTIHSLQVDAYELLHVKDLLSGWLLVSNH